MNAVSNYFKNPMSKDLSYNVRSRNKLNLITRSLTKLKKLKGWLLHKAVSVALEKLRNQSNCSMMNTEHQKRQKKTIQLIFQFQLKNVLTN